ncbi:MAG: elongation factor Ts [Erysipelotrichales bacterium]|nr:elongation factor Ts [Erysipelotrichales bacterium]
MAAVTMAMVKELRERTEAGFMDCKKALTECDGDMEKAIDWLRKKGASKAVNKAGRIAAEGLAKVVVEGNTALLVEVNCETDFAAGNVHFQELVDKTTAWIMEHKPATVEEALSGGVQELINDATAVISEKLSLRRFEFVTKNDDEAFGEYTHMNKQIVSVVVTKPANEEVANNMAMQVAAMAPQYVSLSDIPAEVLEHEKEIQLALMEQNPAEAAKPAAVKEKMVQGRIEKTFKPVCLDEQEFFLDTTKKCRAYLKEVGVSIVKMVRFKVGEGIEKKQENFAEEVAKAL